jgi:hypothetical protein
MPSTTTTTNTAKVSQYLAAVDIMKGGLFGSKINENWDVDLYMERKAVEWAYDQSATYENIYETTQYLYWLCYKTNRAQYIINSNTGGELAPVQSPDDCCIDLYPIHITQDDFEDDGVSYNNSDIVGDNIMIFVNQVSQTWWFSGGSNPGFVYTSTGIRITIPGFDATLYEYDIVIEKLGSADASPSDTPNVVNYNLTENDTPIEGVNATIDGQIITITVQPNGFTYNFDSNYFIAGDQPALQTPTNENTINIFNFQYIAAANKLLLIGTSLNIPV